MEAHVNNLFGERTFLTIQRVLGENRAASTYWKEYIGLLTEPVISFEDQVQLPLERLRGSCHSYIKKKSGALLETVTLGPDFAKCIVDFEAANSAVLAYNAAVDSANQLIQEQKLKAQAGDLKKVQASLGLLRAIKHRHEPDVAKACSEYQTATDGKILLEEQKRKAKIELDKYTEEVLSKYETRINQLLKMFSASFRIGGTKRSYVGGTPSSSYHIIINDIPVQLGDNGTPIGWPCFRNTLSAGDRTTLALAFFIAQLEQDPHKALETVVFDDPFTSQDRSRRNCTQQLLCKICASSEQVIVLSHDPAFLKLIWDSLPAAEVKTPGPAAAARTGRRHIGPVQPTHRAHQPRQPGADPRSAGRHRPAAAAPDHLGALRLCAGCGAPRRPRRGTDYVGGQFERRGANRRCKLAAG